MRYKEIENRNCFGEKITISVFYLLNFFFVLKFCCLEIEIMFRKKGGDWEREVVWNLMLVLLILRVWWYFK